MPLSPLEHLRHILDEADYLAAHITGLDREQFRAEAGGRKLEVRGQLLKTEF